VIFGYLVIEKEDWKRRRKINRSSDCSGYQNKDNEIIIIIKSTITLYILIPSL
jgi:hypothetical protein